ncbi:hypothetical protein F0U61_19115 [Archangium violaceum]|nr:hypothetical protein F0U61_19115 [Archangium violaceum]
MVRAMSNHHRPVLPPSRQLSQHIISLWVPQAIHAASELGIADALAAGPATSHEVSGKLGTHPEATLRLMKALVALGLLSLSEGRFSLTELGQCLASDTPTSVRSWSRLMGGAWVWRTWGQLTTCVRTGHAAGVGEAARASDTELFDAMAKDGETAAIFNQAMAELTRDAAPGIVDAIDWGGVERVVDVGGGSGELLCAALEAHPHLRGDVFDLEHARAGALALLAKRGLTGRASFTVGNLFDTRPPSAGVLLLKSVIHAWDDARSLQILTRCREAMGPRDRLVLVEPPAPAPDASLPGTLAWMMAFSDLNMLVNTGGKERTEAEYRALLEQAGLRVIGVRPTSDGVFSVFEAVNMSRQGGGAPREEPNMNAGSGPHSIDTTYVHLGDGGTATPIEVTESFWSDLSQGRHPELERGRLISHFSFDEDWSTWEMHPHGDEIVLLLSGAVDFVLEQGPREKVVRLRTPGSFVLVPRGVWHTAKALERSSILAITAGEGTQHRPVTR